MLHISNLVGCDQIQVVGNCEEEQSGSRVRVGDKLQVKVHDGRTADATVRAIVEDGEQLQMDFGHEETALVKASQA